MNILNNQRLLICGKGGSGKSVLTSLLASTFARSGHTVALLDADTSNPGGLTRLSMDMINGPEPLVNLISPGQRNGHNFHDPWPANLDDIPPRYYLENDNIYLFQAGKIPYSGITREKYRQLVSKFFIRNAVMILDMKAGIDHIYHINDILNDIILVMVTPEYESIQLADRINRFCRERGQEHVWVILNDIVTDSMEKEVKTQLYLRGLEIIGTVFHDNEIRSNSLAGNMIANCPSVETARHITYQLANMYVKRTFHAID